MMILKAIRMLHHFAYLKILEQRIIFLNTLFYLKEFKISILIFKEGEFIHLNNKE